MLCITRTYKKVIGSELIRRIMERHVMLGRNAQDACLLTLDSAKDWCSLFGFELIYKMLPNSFEVLL